MKELLNQDRAMTIGLAKVTVGTIGAAFLVTSIAIILLGISTLIGGNFLPAIVQIVGGPALLLSIYMLLRLLIEILMAAHRGNDRLGLMSEALRERREPGEDTA